MPELELLGRLDILGVACVNLPDRRPIQNPNHASPGKVNHKPQGLNRRQRAHDMGRRPRSPVRGVLKGNVLVELALRLLLQGVDRRQVDGVVRFTRARDAGSGPLEEGF